MKARGQLSAALALLFIGFWAPSSEAQSGDLCVNPGGTGGCEKSIQAAIDNAQPNDTITVARGTYSEDVVIDRPVALIGAGRGSTIIDATHLSNGINVDGYDNMGLSHVIVRGFTVKNANFEGIVVTNASDVTIADNRVTGNDRSLQLSDGAPPACPGLPSYFVAFQGLDCGEGVHLSGVTNSLVSNNVIDHNSGGILVSDDTGANHDNFITGNDVHDNPYDCSITLATHDLNPTMGLPPKGVYHITVKGNTVVRNGLETGEGAGVGIFAPTPGSQNYGNVVVDNVLMGNGLPGVTLHSHAPGQNVNDQLIAGNTIAGNGPDPDAGTHGKTGIVIMADTGEPGDAGLLPISGIKIIGNTIFGEDTDVAVLASGDVAVHQNNLFSPVGVDNLGSASINATLNWWKCRQGPGNGPCSTAEGPNVQVAPWLDRPDH
ncbi:MAG TPA: right-handed parallel beta-helix repeat-containing protein [Gammaproteobacteria bacterium]|nr:right-handed parallel beta-helix repeat-containing protein [Gammaproteobacteria bacterium]